MNTSLHLNSRNIISVIDDRLYSSFIEHMGRAVYTGIYEPDHPTADADGFRCDVAEHVRALRLSHIRYPGGNFLSGYRWEDGVGDRSSRPVRRDLAWFALEPNWVGINEFIAYCRGNGIEPMIGVNLGTRAAQDAVNLLEYCNVEKGTYYSDLRRSHGYEEAHRIGLWCLGNEMDGPWQIGAKTAEEYGRIACETAKMMKWMDPSIELVVCGSSFRDMPTFGAWERTVLAHCWDYVDYLSLHQYYQNNDGDVPSFLARSVEMDAFIKEVASICAEEKTRRGSDHDVRLSFDEWNVWYHFRKAGRYPEKWIFPRPIEEETYDFADALLVGSMLTTLLNNADTVKIACLAQLVNVIAPIMTESGGQCWLQTIYYPFLYTSLHGRGIALRPEVECPVYQCALGEGVPTVDCAAVLSSDKKELTVFLVNKDLKNPSACRMTLEGLKPAKAGDHLALSASLDSVNTADASPVLPRKVSDTKSINNGITFTLEAASWNMIRLPLI
ncbi:MAG: alpha-N-arabinofuranosidase [Spirochaetales bacterium]|nr:alpha-N-arabinofuranosidase [Spirochaetales bacterium]